MVITSRISTRLRVALILGAVLVVFVVLNTIVLGGLVFPAFAAFEREDAMRNIGRVSQAVRRELDFIADFSRDWAHWDDTWAHLGEHSDAYVQGNLSDEATQNTPTDVIALYDLDGRPRHLGVYRGLSAHAAATRALLDRDGKLHRLAVQPLLGEDVDVDAEVVALLAFGGRPLLVAAHPVLPSDRDGPSRGVLLMARLLDGTAAERLEEQTLVSFSIVHLPVAGPVPDEDDAENVEVRVLGRDLLHVATRLPTIDGSAFEFRSVYDRRMTRHGGLALLLALSISTITLALLVGGVYWRLISRSFLLPLRAIVDSLQRIDGEARLGTRLPVEGAAELQRLSNAFNEMMTRLEQQQAEITRLSLTDTLTGLPNRRRFEQVWEREWQRSLREREPLALLVADIDHFKPYNDRYGHLRGDDCLRRAACALAEALNRGTDFIARYGGEEFLIVLPNTGPAGAVHTAERLRDAIRALDEPHADATGGRLTISIGAFSAMPSAAHQAEDWIARADAALYEAKAGGRDRVVTASLDEGDAAAPAGPRAR